MKHRVLAICIHNSARSQMTEEYIRLECGNAVEVESAGIEPGVINPVVVALLKEDGVDISGKETRSVFDLHSGGKSFDYVIAVCGPEAADRCPVFPSEKARLHWPFPDPSEAVGTFEEKLNHIRPIREQIRAAAREFCRSLDQ